MFLTIDELARLSGLQRPSAQIRWLAARGWRFELDRAGRPVVAVAEAERRLVSGSAPTVRSQEPDFSSLTARQGRGTKNRTPGPSPVPGARV